MPEKEGVFEKSEDIDPESELLSEHDEHHESVVKREIEVDIGKHDADVYTEEGREILEEGGEIEPWEEGFSEGAEDRGHLAKCAHCHEILSDEEDKVVEREYNGEVYRFCSDKCAQAGPKL